MNGRSNKSRDPLSPWIARILISIVLLINFQAAIFFMLAPELFVHSFNLDGEPGLAAISGTGILFLMWQVPYFFSVLDPQKNLNSLIEAVIMQAIGLIGESLLYGRVSSEFLELGHSIHKFIVFDGCGLILLIIALVLVLRMNRSNNPMEKKC